MTVVAYPHIQPQGSGPWVETELRSITRVFRSPENGAVRSVGRPGDAWAFTVRYQNLSLDDAGRLQAFLASCRGQANRFYLPAWCYVRRGSGFGSELFSNGDFANGTTGWAVYQSADLTAPDNSLRFSATQGGGQHGFTQDVSLTQYVPYVLRSILHEGRGSSGINIGVQIGSTTVSESTDRGLRAIARVPLSTGSATNWPAYFADSTGYGAGDYSECSFASLSRCALVDNGQNLLIRSDQFDNAAWTKTGVSISADNVVDPVGTTTADQLIEDSSTGGHSVTSTAAVVSSSAEDIAFSVAVKPNNRTWCWLQIDEDDGSSSALAYFNLSSGATGITSAGANWSNIRTFAEDIGNGWYRLSLVARKTNSADGITARVGAADSDGGATYTGTNALSAIYLWRGTVAQSSVPTRLIQTTTAAQSETGQTGSALHLKGLPASTDNLLRSGDWVQVMLPNIGSQFVRTIAPLNSDAAGLGYLQFEPELWESPDDSAAVIVTNPLGRFLLDSNSIRSVHTADDKVDIEFVAVEDVVPA